MAGGEPRNPYAAPEAEPRPAGPPDGPRRGLSPAEAGIGALILTFVVCVCLAGAENARAAHAHPPLLPAWLHGLLDRNGDGVLNVIDDPLVAAAWAFLPPTAALGAAGAVRLVRRFLGRKPSR